MADLCQGMRAVALGMYDLGGAAGKVDALFALLLGNHVEDLFKLGERRFARGHQRVTAGDGRDLSHPGFVFLAVENGLVVMQRHRNFLLHLTAVYQRWTRLHNLRWRRIVRGSDQVSVGNDVFIRLARGELGVTVKSKR